MSQMIYKVVHRREWEAAEASGVFRGAAIDLEDGFIHFSTADQLVETLEKHFAGQEDLVLVAVEERSLGDEIRWEPSRGGKLFPHLYGNLAVSDTHAVFPLPLRSDGTHELPKIVQPE